MDRDILVALVLIPALLLGCSSKTPITLTSNQEATVISETPISTAPTPTAPTLPSLIPSEGSTTPTPTPTPETTNATTQTPPPTPEPKPASFVINALTITPKEVTPGSSAAIEVLVTNSGELSGTYDFTLKIGDKIEHKEIIVLEGGASQNVTFSVTKWMAGTYSVNIGGQSGTLVVKSLPLPPLDTFEKGIALNDWPPLNSPTPGYELYASPTVDQSLKTIATTGANWIALIVHVGQETTASTTIFRTQSNTISSTATDSALLHVINVAHSLGMRVMLTTNIALSGDPTKQWEGLIGKDFTNESQWQDWFTSYRDLINHYATFAQEAGVDMLSVGHELGGTTHRESDWRRVIREVRERFKGPITYSSLCSYNLSISPANLFPHGEEKRITWWDAVDYIGVDVYYQLTDKNDPVVEELKKAWTQRGYIALLEGLSSRFNKSIIFTEFGYFSRDGTNKDPGNFTIASTIDLQEQADCYRAALEVLWGKPWLAGIFWFAWDANLSIRPGGPNAPSMTPYGKPAEEVLKKFYLSQ